MDERELLSSKFASEVESLQATQRREFRDWVSFNLDESSFHALALAGYDSARGVQDEQPVAGPGAKIRVELLPLFTGQFARSAAEADARRIEHVLCIDSCAQGVALSSLPNERYCQ